MTDKTDNEDSSYNHLKNEKSPYLLQHADNPVNWYPWSEEAFQKAKKEDKPIFLSIGYSTCHWCHVMAHESFEDEEIAKLLNETFVCIKVDREERPDIDNLYMKICTMLTGRGGWPLTIILDTQKRPFFAGTYFPKESRYGVIGLKHLIYRIRDYWENRRSELETSAKEIITELQNYHEKSTKGSAGLDKTILKQAFNNIEHSFDNIHGGFSVAPKFPSPHKMYFLLRYWQRTNNQKALEMVEKTLTKMRLGGIYDQLGFGFHRYSTDRQWKVPHFEKMLYDQALLIFLYTEAYQATNKVLYQQTVVEIISYLQTTLLDKQGGFYSAQDADSEGEEGKYYTWTNKELKDILTKKEYSFIASIFTIIDSGNFVDQASGEKTGRNILYLSQSFADLSEQFNLTKTAFLRKFTEIRQKLLRKRQKRSPPHIDDKILTDWNGLIIAALAKAGRIFGEEKYIALAKKASEFLMKNLFKNNQLYHRYRKGETGIKGLLDDYTFLIWGLLELYESTFDYYYLKIALQIQEIQDKKFLDDEPKKGYYLTPEDGEKLLLREKTIHDGALPSGNSIAIYNLIRLSRITANQNQEQLAEKIIQSFSERIKEALSAHTMVFVSLEYLYGTSYEFVFVGSKRDPELEKLIKKLREEYLPNKIVLYLPLNSNSREEIFKLTEFVKYKKQINEKATVYVCKNKFCKKPVNTPNQMLKQIHN